MAEKNIEFLICPEGHQVPYETWNVANDFSDGGVDAMSLEPLYEHGLYYSTCDRPYGISKLKKPEQK